MPWKPTTDVPEHGEGHEWSSPSNDLGHQSETTAPGDFNLFAKDVTLVPREIQKGGEPEREWMTEEVDDTSTWSVEPTPSD